MLDVIPFFASLTSFQRYLVFPGRTATIAGGLRILFFAD
jgi:hypothetical protein